MDAPAPITRGVRLTLDLWVLLLSAVLAWPLLSAAGHPLARDLVFTPRQPMRPEWLGLGDAPARAVPLDALVSLADAVVGGAVLSRVAVLGLLIVSGAAAHRLLAAAHPVARGATAALAIWNPFVIERLALGQWALLWAYASGFAIVGAAAQYRRGGGGTRRLAPVAVALAAAAITPTGALFGAAAALVTGSAGRSRKTLALLVVCGAVQLPWLLPTLLGEGGLLSDPRGVAVFSARSERPGGPIWSLVGLGGIWDATSTPLSRAGAFGHVSSALAVVCLLLGWARLGRSLGGTTRRRLALLGGLGLLGASLTTTSIGLAAGESLVGSVPGAGLFRDGQKLLLPFAVLVVLCFGAAVDQVLGWAATRATALVPGLATVLVALPVVAVPDATTATWPTLQPVTYPDDLDVVARIVDGSGQALVSLPWEPYRVYRWGSASAVFDPASRWFDVEVITSDRLRVGSTLLTSESARSAAVERVLAGGEISGRRLAAVGVRWVLVQRDAAGGGEGASAADPFGAAAAVEAGGVDGVVTRHAGSEFVLVETVGPWAVSEQPPFWKVALVALVDVLLLAALAGAVLAILGGPFVSRRRPSGGLLAGMLPRTQRGS